MKSASEVGAELNTLAGKAAYQNMRIVLGELGRDLESGDVGRWRRWRRVEVLALCDSDAVGTGTSRSWFRGAAQIVDLVRNLFLFLPLLITWGGIFFAVQAYRSLLAAPPAEQRQFTDASFLQMWTRGFGGRTWVTLDVVALADFAAILMVILLFIGGAELQRHAAVKADELRQQNVDRLRVCLLEAILIVTNEDETTVDRLVDSTKELLRTSEDTLGRLLKSQQELAKSVDSGTQSMVELASRTEELAKSGEAIARNAERLNVPAEALARTVETMETATGRLVSNTAEITNQLPAVHQGLLDMRNGVRELSVELRDLHAHQIEDLKQQIPVYQTTIRQLLAAQREMTASIETGKGNIAELATATSQLATTGNALVVSSEGIQRHIADMAAATDEFDRLVTLLVAGAGDLNTRLPSLKQSIIDVLTGIKGLGGKLDDLYARQEVIAQELGVLADNPLAAAQAAKRTAEAARAAEDAMRTAITALPAQMDQLRAAVVAALDREIEERRHAARALADSSEFTRQTIESALGTLLTTSTQAADTLRESIDKLRDSPRHVLPDLGEVAGQLAETLVQSRVLVESLVQSAGNGRGPGARWWPRAGRRRSKIGA